MSRDALPGVLKHDKKILVISNDPAARSLAERIVALAAMDTAASADARAIVRAVPDAALRPMRVEPTQASDFQSRLRSGSEFAYIDALSWCSDFPFVVDRFASNAAWLSHPAQSVIPLVETRAHFIAISDRVGFVDDHTGDVRIMMPGEEIRR